MLFTDPLGLDFIRIVVILHESLMSGTSYDVSSSQGYQCLIFRRKSGSIIELQTGNQS